MRVEARWKRRDFEIDASTLAQRLIGQRLVHLTPGGTRVSGLIVETEAYLGVEDRAAHCFGGRRTVRNESMYAKGGTAYVYFTYGMHHCMNVVCGRKGEPTAVLLRALEPSEGIGLMRRRRSSPGRTVRSDWLCSGPACLCVSMGIDLRHNGLDLTSSDRLFVEWSGKAETVLPLDNTARVGVGYAGDWGRSRLRWAVRGSRFVSRGRPVA